MIDELVERLSVLLKGKIPAKIDAAMAADVKHRQAVELVNQLIDFIKEINDFIVPLAKGELQEIQIQPRNFLGSPFKELHSRLQHLTWQTKQVAIGDYSQRVDFMGDFSEAFNSMVVCLEKKERSLKKKIEDLEGALSHIKKLEGILPICSNCKKIRLENTNPYEANAWVVLERYIQDRTEARFSHSLCPDCMKRLYPDFAQSLDREE